MTATAVVLLCLVAWTLLHVMALGTYRTVQVLSKKRAANSFAASGDDVDGFGKRLTRVHANCYEFLPMVAIILLYAIATGQTHLTDGLALAFLGGRIAQSVTHLISTSATFVLIRFGFFGVQLVIMVIWLLKLFHHL